MKKILVVFVLAALFAVIPHDSLAQSKPKAKTDPTLRPSKQQKKVKKKIVKRKKKSASLMRSSESHAFYWRRNDDRESDLEIQFV